MSENFMIMISEKYTDWTGPRRSPELGSKQSLRILIECKFRPCGQCQSCTTQWQRCTLLPSGRLDIVERTYICDLSNLANETVSRTLVSEKTKLDRVTVHIPAVNRLVVFACAAFAHAQLKGYILGLVRWTLKMHNFVPATIWAVVSRRRIFPVVSFSIEMVSLQCRYLQKEFLRCHSGRLSKECGSGCVD
jgi:hypothetical protein